MGKATFSFQGYLFIAIPHVSDDRRSETVGGSKRTTGAAAKLGKKTRLVDETLRSAFVGFKTVFCQ